jgi:hypothetical protein
MKNKVVGRAFLPIFIVFLVLCLLILGLSSILHEWNVDGKVLLGGNAVLFFVTAISYWLHIKSLRSSNPHVFVRMVYGSLLVKMLVCLLSVLIYALQTRVVNRNAIIGSFIIYIIYTFLEIRILTQLTKKLPKNA